MRTQNTNEFNIEEEICFYLQSQGVSIEKINSEGFYDQKKGIYRKRKSKYSRPGISDLVGVIPPYGRALYIEVKQMGQMKRFDKPAKVLEEDLIVATYDKGLSKSSLAKYQHAVDQARFIENKIKHGAVAFYASSVKEVQKKLKDFGVNIS